VSGGRLRRLLHAVAPIRVRRPLGIAVFRAVGAARRIRSLPREILGRLPLLAARERVYDEAFYERGDPEIVVLYDAMVDALLELRSPASVVDVGCGSGLMLRRFRARGVLVRGVEGSRAAIRRSALGDVVVRANLERGVPQLGRFDLCLCIEVAEHLRPAAAPRLVAGLAGLSDVVVFSAAGPGQPGTAHLNVRPKDYWSQLFARHGFVPAAFESELARAVAAVPEPAYIHTNLMVFERARPYSPPA
jgi:SAM-dependent methyltransferase